MLAGSAVSSTKPGSGMPVNEPEARGPPENGRPRSPWELYGRIQAAGTVLTLILALPGLTLPGAVAILLGVPEETFADAVKTVVATAPITLSLVVLRVTLLMSFRYPATAFVLSVVVVFAVPSLLADAGHSVSEEIIVQVDEQADRGCPAATTDPVTGETRSSVLCIAVSVWWLAHAYWSVYGPWPLVSILLAAAFLGHLLLRLAASQAS